eukprot:4685759-Prymnesium_polylepis.1
MSPCPAALATSGAVTVGMNATRKKTEKKHVLAAPCPAKARASPIRPTQNVSTAPTSGATARLATDGRATSAIRRSSSSPHGSDLRRRSLDAS